MVKVKCKGDFRKANSFFNHLLSVAKVSEADRYGQEGVARLREETPKDTGKTADSWDYEIERKHGRTTIYWTNSNTNEGVNIAAVLQYGHGTQNGSYVQGIDYVNPAMSDVFDGASNNVREEVRRS